MLWFSFLMNGNAQEVYAQQTASPSGWPCEQGCMCSVNDLKAD